MDFFHLRFSHLWDDLHVEPPPSLSCWSQPPQLPAVRHREDEPIGFPFIKAWLYKVPQDSGHGDDPVVGTPGENPWWGPLVGQLRMSRGGVKSSRTTDCTAQRDSSDLGFFTPKQLQKSKAVASLAIVTRAFELFDVETWVSGTENSLKRQLGGSSFWRTHQQWVSFWH